MKNVKVIGESFANNVAHRFLGLLRFALQKLPKTSWQRALELRHGGFNYLSSLRLPYLSPY